jgi:hypothetical protein
MAMSEYSAQTMNGMWRTDGRARSGMVRQACVTIGLTDVGWS